MKKKNWIALLLALVMMFALAACGAKETPSDTPEPANALEKIKSEGVLTVTLSPDFSPMEFIDSSKQGQEQYVGFDVTLAKYIAESLGVKLVIEPMSFDACQSAVYTGSVPMSISGYSWTEERAQNYELSDYYYAGENETEQVLLIRKDDAAKYTKPEDFDGQDVGAQNASLQMQMVTDQLSKANPITIGDISVGVMELKAGNIEALAVAKGNGEMIVDANPDLVKCSWQFAVEEKYEEPHHHGQGRNRAAGRRQRGAGKGEGRRPVRQVVRGGRRAWQVRERKGTDAGLKNMAAAPDTPPYPAQRCRTECGTNEIY